jgi:hypothetical protein
MKEYEKWREFKDSPVAGAPTECWINAVEIVSGLACNGRVNSQGV